MAEAGTFGLSLIAPLGEHIPQVSLAPMPIPIIEWSPDEANATISSWPPLSVGYVDYVTITTWGVWAAGIIHAQHAERLLDGTYFPAMALMSEDVDDESPMSGVMRAMILAREFPGGCVVPPLQPGPPPDHLLTPMPDAAEGVNRARFC